MNKNEFIKEMASKGGISQKDAKEALCVFIHTLTDVLESGEEVKIFEFGSFKVKTMKEKKGRNPQTSEPLIIPTFKKVKFRASKVLEDKCCK